ncbi:MAG: hypothetical protein DYH12_30390, partial [Sorangiineae bacterium PRO1]|nr:hypothetical protein [Sorangiineae bacterium PRO1]
MAWFAGTMLMGIPYCAPPKSGCSLSVLPFTKVISFCVHAASTVAPETSRFHSSPGGNIAQ